MSENIKEDFCPPCLMAIPLAFAASSATGGAVIDGKTDKGKYWKDVAFWASIILTIISIVVFVVFKFIIKCKNCSD